MAARPTTLIDDRPLEVLLIGDDASLADMYRLKLELDGYAVTGIPRLDDLTPRRKTPDLVLIDIEDGDRQRLADLDRLRADRALKAVPRIILATLRLEELRARGIVLDEDDNLICVPLPSQGSELSGYGVVDWRTAGFASA